MSVKVKRGLGLLVVAVLGVLCASTGRTVGGPGGSAVESLGWLVVAVGLLGGLGLLAWGLLRD